VKTRSDKDGFLVGGWKRVEKKIELKREGNPTLIHIPYSHLGLAILTRPETNTI
jgi:hypothetical protein